MQFSQGSIKELAAISGCLNKAIVAETLRCLPADSLSRPCAIRGRAILLADLICLFRRHPHRNVRQRGGGGRAFSRDAMGRVGRVIGGAISSFIKRIVRPLGVARHAGVGGERRKGTAEGKGRGRVVTPTK